ncbi:hypothetical protein HOD38_03640 [archaeon]|jgi:hypothetical protein|nr:hypothetical protein [archaeon]MBT4397333.1 hypothetical protein [archaeon]MBT4440713.1 hypothetical protein [archaeon]
MFATIYRKIEGWIDNYRDSKFEDENYVRKKVELLVEQTPESNADFANRSISYIQQQHITSKDIRQQLSLWGTLNQACNTIDIHERSSEKVRQIGAERRKNLRALLECNH